MKTRHIYLALAALGIALPYYQYWGFYQQFGNDLPKFLNDALINASSRFVLMDMVITAFAFFVFVAFDNRKRRIKYVWLAIVGVFMVGVSFGLPLYLYLRDKYGQKLEVNL